jgi:hypothetical protein
VISLFYRTGGEDRYAGRREKFVYIQSLFVSVERGIFYENPNEY